MNAQGNNDQSAQAPGAATAVLPSTPGAPPRRRLGCWRCGCLALGIPLLVILLATGWVAGVQSGWFEQVGLVKAPEDRLLGWSPNPQAATALKAELLAAGLSEAGLEVAVLPVKGKDYNLAVVVMDASQGFQGSGSADLLLDSMQRLATGGAAQQYDIGRVAVHYKDPQGAKLLSLTAATQDIRAFAAGQIDRRAFLQAVEGELDWGSLLGGMP